ncbi:MAG: hypothetical protein V4797_05805 [Paraburkholderia tropica]|uniref:hypothetical protein n=1 Tax=Paraburkholderia tropica TaxID=92647 RepID=UPI00310124E9
MEKCVFCDCDLLPGSEEHVFLSALGGRIATYRALCEQCNNAFANAQTGKVDDALAKGFEEIRNGLKVWSGRNGSPPTLIKAGTLPSGIEFDLAPGFVPVVRAGRLPNQLPVGSEHTLTARDEADARRMLDILEKRGISAQVGSAMHVQQKAGQIRRSLSFDGPKVWRSVAKTAVVSFVVLYGNEQARRFVSLELRQAVRHGTPSIANFAGWDFTNEWPAFISLEPHSKTPQAQRSGFEHSVVIADVGDNSVAYVTLFGGFRFSVVLGARTHLPVRGLAVNPREPRPARFIVNARAPERYEPKHVGSFASEQTQIRDGIVQAFGCAMQTWQGEAHASYAEELANDLFARIEQAGEGDAARTMAINEFARKLAEVEFGSGWSTDLGSLFIEDEQ